MVQTAVGQIRKLVALRLKPGDDVFAGVEEVCRQNNLTNAVIISGLGSLAQIAYCIPEEKADGSFSYGDPYIKQGPFSVVNMTGMICRTETGDLLPHIHICASSIEHGFVGGHVVAGCKTLVSMDAIIGEVDGMVLGRRYDEDLNMPVFDPRQI